jgi:YaiO family outer membrane protein
MKRGALIALALPLFVWSPASGSDSPDPVPLPNTQIIITGTDEAVTDNRGSWSDVSGEIIQSIAPRESFYALGGIASRFNQTDPHYTVGGYAPLGTRAFLNLEASFSPTHLILPQTDLLGSVEDRLGGGWGYAGGYERRLYTNVGATIYSLMLDRYVGNYRFAYRVSAANLSNVAGLALTHDLRATRYYGARGDSSVGLALTAGRDVENIGTSVLVSPVRGVSLSGVHWFERDWALDWNLETQSLNRLYSRSGASLGLHFRF